MALVKIVNHSHEIRSERDFHSSLFGFVTALEVE